MEKEDLHIIQVLTSTKRALTDEDPIKLRELSDQTIHSACGIQDEGSLTIVVLIYSNNETYQKKLWLICNYPGINILFIPDIIPPMLQQ